METGGDSGCSLISLLTQEPVGCFGFSMRLLGVLGVSLQTPALLDGGRELGTSGYRRQYFTPNTQCGAMEMAQWIKPLATKPGVLNSIPSIYKVGEN